MPLETNFAPISSKFEYRAALPCSNAPPCIIKRIGNGFLTLNNDKKAFICVINASTYKMRLEDADVQTILRKRVVVVCGDRITSCWRPCRVEHTAPRLFVHGFLQRCIEEAEIRIKNKPRSEDCRLEAQRTECFDKRPCEFDNR